MTSCSTHKIDQQETDGKNSKIRQSEIDLLTEQVSRFWEFDSIGIKENEPSVYETFVENTKHDGTHNEVNLP